VSARAQVSTSQCVQPKSLPGFYLRPDAAAALDRASKAFGKRLIVTGALRSYATQERIFRERYQVQWVGGGAYGDVRWWKGTRYVRRFGTAAAAVPGTSNHGSGDAIDVKTLRESGDPSHDVAVVFTSWSDKDRVRFLKVAAEHGWDDEEGRRVNELWHLTYYPARDRHRGSVSEPAKAKKRKPKRLRTTSRARQRLHKSRWSERLGQRALRELGHYKGAIDGDFGPKSTAATKSFQKSRGLKADGVIGKNTWYELARGTSRGESGVYVEVAQRVMGFTGAGVDGKHGPSTDVRAKQVQHWLGVDDDGDWGPQTITTMRKKG
jgi:hypothetical protein